MLLMRFEPGALHRTIKKKTPVPAFFIFVKMQLYCKWCHRIKFSVGKNFKNNMKYESYKQDFIQIDE